MSGKTGETVVVYAVSHGGQIILMPGLCFPPRLGLHRLNYVRWPSITGERNLTPSSRQQSYRQRNISSEVFNALREGTR